MINTLLVICLFLGYTVTTFGQGKSKEDLLRKGKIQTTVGSVLVLGGMTASTAGLFMAFDQEKGDTGSQLLVWGLFTAVVGTPVLVIGSINRHKANRMSFKNEPIYIPNYAGNHPRSVPSLAIKIPL